MNAILDWWPVLVGIGTGLLALGAIHWENKRHGREIKVLWDKKAEAKALDELQIKVAGIDHWTRSHEKEASDMRLKFAEQMASMQKAIELANSHRDELVRLIERMEATVDKVDRRVEEIAKNVTEFMLRRGWEVKDR